MLARLSASETFFMGAFRSASTVFGRCSGRPVGGVLSQADSSIKKQPRIAQSAQAGVSEKRAVNCSGVCATALVWESFNN